MKKIILIVTIAVMTGCSQSPGKTNQQFQLAPLLDQYSKEYYALNPLAATEEGINDYNDQLEITINEDYRTKTIAQNKKYLDTLSVINKVGLTSSELLSIDILTYKLKSEIERLSQ